MRLDLENLDTFGSLAGRCIEIWAHDAGGAAVIRALVDEVPTSPLIVETAGPAESIFSNLPHIRRRYSETACSELVITSTSSDSFHEFQGWARARHRNVPCVAVLDHWVNYESRFVRDGEWHWPNEIWVTDNHAFNLASSTFPEMKIRQVPAFFRIRHRRVVKQLKQSRELLRNPTTTRDILNVLVLDEPLGRSQPGVHKEGNQTSPDEVAMRAQVIKALNTMTAPARVRFRPHPIQRRSPYNLSLGASERLDVHISPYGSSLAADLAWSDLCLGVSSMSLIHAVDSGIPTLQVFPTEKIHSPIPISLTTLDDWAASGFEPVSRIRMTDIPGMELIALDAVGQ